MRKFRGAGLHAAGLRAALRSTTTKAATFGSAVALTAMSFAAGSAAATPTPVHAAPASKSAGTLPADLAAAVRRDLKISPEEYLDRAVRAQRLAHYAKTFRAQHPKQFAGAWMTADGKATVAVTNPDAAKIAATDGFQTKLASVSADGLDAALEQLTHILGGLPPAVSNQIGSAGIDFLNNQLIVVVANSSVGQVLNLPTLLARVKVVLSPNGSGPVVHHPMGGDTYISVPKALNKASQVVTICSFGFNAVDSNGTPLSISAGHCDPNLNGSNRNAPVFVPNVRDVAASPQAGTFAKSNLGGEHGLDYSLIKLTDRAVRAGMDQPRVRGANGTTVTLTGVADPVIGAPVCKSGQTSAFTCGLIVADNVQTQLVTDDGAQRTIRGFSTNACTLSGDSGGSIITGTLALGITSGSNSSAAPDCNAANLELALDGGTASLGIPITRILADANATSGGGLGAGLRLRTAG